MRKKDYELIASSLHRCKMVNCQQLEGNRVKREAKNAMLRLVATDLATTLKDDNPRFDRQKFMKACGLDS